MARQKILPGFVVATLAAALVLTLAGPAGAAASPVSDCNAHSRLTAHYSPTQLRSALATMPADIKEYTNCYDVIQRALLTEVGQLHGSGHGPGSAGGSGGSFLPTPVIVVLIALVVAAAAVGMLALRRRGGGSGADQLG